MARTAPTAAKQKGVAPVLERMPFKHLSREDWRAAMGNAAQSGPAGATAKEMGGHLESGALLRDVIAQNDRGVSTSPHWTALPVLP